MHHAVPVLTLAGLLASGGAASAGLVENNSGQPGITVAKRAELTGRRQVHNPRPSTGRAGEEPVSEARCRSARSLRTPRARLRPPGRTSRPGGTAADIRAMTQHVLRESYRGNTEDLRDPAAKVKHYKEQKKKLRGALSRARGHVRASGHRCGPAASPEIRKLCAGIARLERRLREIEVEKRRNMR